MITTPSGGSRPYFSLIMPAYNRAHTIERAIASCLAQTFSNFELLVSDDGSTDDTSSAATRLADPRIRVLRSDLNRGPCPARNAAIRAASGEWCVMVDSDFALLPHALERLHERAMRAPAGVGNLASSCRWDTGQVTPDPREPTRVLTYTDYLAWLQAVRVSEKLECIRRSILDVVRYPDSRAWEFEFHIDLARVTHIELSDEILVTVHSDAGNRLTTARGRTAVERALADAEDKFTSFEAVLSRHGPEMRRAAPELYRYTVTLAGHHALLAGRRAAGVRRLTAGLRHRPQAASVWGALILGTLSRRAIAWATVLRRQTVGL